MFTCTSKSMSNHDFLIRIPVHSKVILSHVLRRTATTASCETYKKIELETPQLAMKCVISSDVSLSFRNLLMILV